MQHIVLLMRDWLTLNPSALLLATNLHKAAVVSQCLLAQALCAHPLLVPDSPTLHCHTYIESSIKLSGDPQLETVFTVR